MDEFASTTATEELLKQHKRWSYVRTDRNGTRYFNNYNCPKCGGTGTIPYYNYVDEGVCFKCGGLGYLEVPETIKVYTPEHNDELAKKRAARAEKLAAERRANAEKGWPSKLEQAGFAQDPETGNYVIYRVIGNTYAIKDKLRAIGCRYNKAVGWYRGVAPEGYDTQVFTSDDVLTDNHLVLTWKPVDEVKPLWFEELTKEPDPESEWQGAIGDRIDRELHIDLRFAGQGMYGKTSYMYVMTDADGNKYKWNTSCMYDQGKDYHFKGTVKDHVEYTNKGKTIKQTVLTRCKEVQ